MPRKDTNTGPISAQAQQDLVSEGIENFELPKALVTKIAKSAIPESAKLQRETVLALVKGSTVFINYLAATAHDVALSKQHKSISASDVLKALEIIEFGDLNDMLQAELLVYREQAKTDKSKKGSANIGVGNTSASVASASVKNKSTAPAPSSTSISISLAKSKGKEKEKNPGLGHAHILPPPFTSVPLGSVHAHEIGSVSSGPGIGAGVSMDVDVGEEGFVEDTEGEGEVEEVEEEEVGEVQVEEEEEEEMVDDEGIDDEDDEDEGPLPDQMAVEEEELRNDARGLEGVTRGSVVVGEGIEDD